jgi:nicotinamidase-related amidase
MIFNIDPKITALLSIDPQNDVLSEGGAMWNVVTKGVKETKVVEHLVELKKIAKEAGIPVFYSPRYFTDDEYNSWKFLNPLDKNMFKNKMFHKGTWGQIFILIFSLMKIPLY